MSKKIIARAISTVLGCSMLLTAFSGCAPTAEKDSIVIMAEEMSGLFNPYYATSGADMDVVGMTQIGMLSTDKAGNPVAGDEESTVVKAFDFSYDQTADQTTYTFVIKNNLKFSDGQPLTMEDVLFNMYVLLDPSYTGSSTMYSTDIVGLKEYRLQKPFQSDTAADDEAARVEKEAQTRAADRIELLKKAFTRTKENEGQNVYADATMVKAKIYDSSFAITNGYKNAVLEGYNQTGKEDSYYRDQLWADYEYTVDTFREELVSDFKAAKESYDTTTAPYKEHASLFESDIFKFLLYEDYIKPEYEKIPGTNRDDKTKIKNFGNYEHYTDQYDTMDKAIDFVLNDWVTTKFDQVLTGWGTAGTLKTEYAAKAMDIYLHELLVQEGGSETSLKYKNISGIVSLGHSTDKPSVTVQNYVLKENGERDTSVLAKEYKIAREYDETGAVKNADEYEVLEIKVKGQDPKAIYNFGFTVAPAHYYGATEGTEYTETVAKIDIENNSFGVPWADSDFQSKVIQSSRNVEVPMGAGPFKATNANNDDNPTGQSFWSSNVVYYKANHNFMFPVKAEKLRMQVVSSTNAIGQLESGAVDYITPQMTTENYDQLAALSSDGIKMLDSWQLGYGYIGINAGKIPDVNIRKAIMSAMQVELACAYYRLGSCIPIAYPMSKVSWAYPKAGKEVEDDNLPYMADKDWVDWTDASLDEADSNKSIEEKFPNAVSEVKAYMKLANVTTYEVTFTIAGASITEHPTYNVFRQAADILNACGWDVEVKADSQALTKLATGSLEVWAAAWGSTVDPDMYQVYHMDSSATSTYAWGYREIKEGGDSSPDYGDEYKLISQLSELIDKGRDTMEQASRTATYKKALELVLDLAVEMPVYQRKTLYAYNSKTVKGFSDSVNPYSSPLEKIWELELIKD